jgi:hypothetical protein
MPPDDVALERLIRLPGGDGGLQGSVAEPGAGPSSSYNCLPLEDSLNQRRITVN